MTKSSAYTASGQALQNTQAARNAPQDKVLVLKSFMEARLPNIAKWVRGGIRPEALIRFMLLDLQQNEKLRACTPESLYMGLLACATTGLEPGALKGECYLVPFAGKAQFMVGWKGIVKQARRSREVTGLVANVVREADIFEIDLGTSNSIVHKPARGERGSVIGAYAIATLVGGHQEIEFLDREDLERIRAVADKRGPSAAWKDWPDQMSRKSALRRLGKRLPLGDDYYVGMALDSAADEGKDQKEVIDIVTEGAGSKSEVQLERAPQVIDVPHEESDEYRFDPTEVA